MRLRRVAVVEAATYLVLVLAVVIARTGAGPDVVQAVGLVHGGAFLVYAASVLWCRPAMGWSPQETVTLLAAAFLPGGTVVAERRLAIGRHRRAARVRALA